jgi:hypothetical protein
MDLGHHRGPRAPGSKPLNTRWLSTTGVTGDIGGHDDFGVAGVAEATSEGGRANVADVLRREVPRAGPWWGMVPSSRIDPPCELDTILVAGERSDDRAGGTEEVDHDLDSIGALLGSGAFPGAVSPASKTD